MRYRNSHTWRNAFTWRGENVTWTQDDESAPTWTEDTSTAPTWERED